MDSTDVIAVLRAESSAEERESMLRYGIPNDHALGVSVGALKRIARELGRSHVLAGDLWASGWYEARTLAALIDEPDQVTSAQMDRWVREFDSWAICDTVCFHLFDKTLYAWEKWAAWAREPEEFVRRAGYALLWALSAHDKNASDEQFAQALATLGDAVPDSRPLVKKAMDMALRAIGKRNTRLNAVAIETAKRMAESADKHQAWVGNHALRELASEKVQARLGQQIPSIHSDAEGVMTSA